MERLIAGLMGGLLWLYGSAVVAEGLVKETLMFLQEDGRTFLAYNTARTAASSYTLYLDKSERLADYWYIYPNEFKWDEADSQVNTLHFPQGDYAALSAGSFTGQVTVDDSGIYHFKSWDGKKSNNGHYGFWTSPNDFSQFVYVWIFPNNFEVVKYKANRKGEWVRRHNTLAFYSKEVNDLVFDISYRHKSHATLAQVKESMQDERESVKVEQQKYGIRVTLREKLLFPSGSSELSERGIYLLKRLAQQLRHRNDLQLVVSGHTDNVPITSRLARQYASNWELSSARSLAVVKLLEGEGIVGTRLEAKAYGEHRPVASNATEAGRYENRRIEIEIVEPR